VLLLGGVEWPVLLPLLSAPLALPLLAAVRAGSDPRRLNATLAGTARLSLVFAALLAVGLAVPGLAPSGSP
jgi:1,4-dihydroxy-2-naphthoate octaprenyltransferase